MSMRMVAGVRVGQPELFQRALEGMDRYRRRNRSTECDHPSGKTSSRRTSPLAFASWCLFIAVTFATAGVVHLIGIYYVAEPGPTFDTRALVTVRGVVPTGGGGSLLITSTAIRPARPLDVLSAWIGGGGLIRSEKEPGEGRGRLSGAEQIESAKRNALEAACRYMVASGAGGNTAAPLDRLVDRVEINSLKMEGASSGLMFALGIIDLVEEGRLSSDRRIAGTGTISSDGRVGIILGLPLKVGAAERAGAEVFLVPTEQVPDAQRAARRVRVIGVRSLAEAVASLRAR